MIKFPCLAFKESRVMFSREEMQDKMKEANAIGKSCEIGIYAFSEWEDNKPIKESVIIDKVVLKGTQCQLERIADLKLEKGLHSTLIFDGRDFLLFVFEELASLNDLMLKIDDVAEVIKDVMMKITCPGFLNLRTGKQSIIMRKWK